MSKYEQLWLYVDTLFRQNNLDELELSFKQVEEASGILLDHSFLRHKKELISFGYEVKKIYLKDEKIIFKKLDSR